MIILAQLSCTRQATISYFESKFPKRERWVSYLCIFFSFNSGCSGKRHKQTIL